MLTTESQLTTPNRTVEAANGVSYAYRRFGDTSADDHVALDKGGPT